MICPQCSKEAKAETPFCVSCGFRLGPEVSAARTSNLPPQPKLTSGDEFLSVPLIDETTPAPVVSVSEQGGQAVATAVAREVRIPSSSIDPSQNESPTVAALARVTQVRQRISRAPLPGRYIHTLKRVGIGFGAFILAAIVGVYATKGLDSISEAAAKAKAEAAEKEAQRERIEQQYQRWAHIVPADQLQQLLNEAGSKEELVNRIQQDWRTHKFFLRKKE